MKQLIINADDFGYNEGVVRGIVDLHQAGLVSSVSCMTSMPAWSQAATYLRAHPELGSGVHLVFNSGQPVLPLEKVPALLGDDGHFLDDGQILRSVRTGTTAQLRAEFHAQIERFIADAGRPPDHLDNHCGISYVRPDRFRVTLELAKEFDVPIRFPFGDDLRDRAEEMGRVWGYPAWLVLWMGSLYRHRVDRAGIRRPHTFLVDFSPEGPRTVGQLLSVLESAREERVSELLTHPGYDGDWREEELHVLQDPRVRQRLMEPDIELVSFAGM